MCFEGDNSKKGRQHFLRKKVHRGGLAGGFFSDLEMTWLLYCAGAATERGYTHSATCWIS